MERKLRLLFAPEYGWALDYDFDLGELVIFPRFPDVPVIQQALNNDLINRSPIMHVIISMIIPIIAFTTGCLSANAPFLPKTDDS